MPRHHEYLVLKTAVLTDIQLTTSNLAYKYIKGKEPKSLCFDTMVRTKQPKLQNLESLPHTPAQLIRFLKFLGSIIRALKMIKSAA